ncbi:hypothetical protein [Pseudomonas leptonychotis]|uniref:hypothetical protein n=1 Tax=Pseudomonas leptonychotis TaxID=2448482 RepID=UPI00386EE49F
MKKLWITNRHTYFNLASRRGLISHRRKYKKYDPYKVPSPETIGHKSYFLIKAPPTLSFYEVEKTPKNLEATCRFLKEIEKNSSKDCLISFRNTKRITVAALLALRSTLETKSTANRIKFIYSESNEVNQLISEIATDINKPLIRKTRKTEQRKTLMLTSETPKAQDYAVDFILRNDPQNNAERENLFSSAISETIQNVYRHAYSSECLEKKWWLFTQIVGNQLYLAILDRGTGIPNTIITNDNFYPKLKELYPESYKSLELDKTSLIEKITRKPNLNDAELIHLAMQDNINRQLEDKHGQGSKSIKALVQQTDRGVLWVFSNNGLFLLEDNEKKITLPELFQGTLIQWNIGLI